MERDADAKRALEQKRHALADAELRDCTFAPEITEVGAERARHAYPLVRALASDEAAEHVAY